MALPFPNLVFLVSSPSRIHIPPFSSSILSEAEETGRAEETEQSRSQRKKKMESSNCMGLVAVVAVSGSIALVALQVHRRLASDFIKKLESEIGRERNRPRKKVRFAPDVIEPSSNNEEYRRRKRTALPPPTNR